MKIAACSGLDGEKETHELRWRRKGRHNKNIHYQQLQHQWIISPNLKSIRLNQRKTCKWMQRTESIQPTTNTRNTSLAVQQALLDSKIRFSSRKWTVNKTPTPHLHPSSLDALMSHMRKQVQRNCRCQSWHLPAVMATGGWEFMSVYVGLTRENPETDALR